MVLSINYDVLARYLFNKPTKWALDITSYILFWSTFLSAGWLAKIGSHIKITLLLEKVGDKGRRILGIISGLICVFVFGVILWHSSLDVLGAAKAKTLIYRSFPILKFPVIMVIPFGALLILIYFIRDLQSYIRQRSQ